MEGGEGVRACGFWQYLRGKNGTRKKKTKKDEKWFGEKNGVVNSIHC
jgi:hypothetical protein